MPGVEQAGFWPSRWSAGRAATAAAELVELKADGHWLCWTLFTPDDGQTRLWCRSLLDGSQRCLTPDGFSVRSRVYEYGGGSFALAGDRLVFVNESDQQLYLHALQQPALPARQLTAGAHRYADLHLAADGRWLVAVQECRQEGQVVHRLVSVPLDAPQPVDPQVVASGSDFYHAPRLSADGQRLAWISWERPELPWTHTCVQVARRQADGWSPPRTLEYDGEPAALQQPLFDRQGRLQVLNDAGGYWQPWCEDEHGRLQPLPGIAADHAGAPWQMGGSNHLPLDDGSLLVSWFERGFGRLGRYDLQAQRLCWQLPERFTRLRHLALADGRLFCIAGQADAGSALLSVDPHSGAFEVLQQLDAGLPVADISQPRALSFASEQGQSVHTFFYPPCNSRHSLRPGEQPPLVVFLHGGPSSAAYPVFDARIQYWTQRGFAVADLNYRGSTGFGRDYRLALKHCWGESEVGDARALVRYLVQRGMVAADQLFIRGASAGGYTALLALAGDSEFAGGASLYGVTAPDQLRRATHKFEGDYLDWLLGDPQQSDPAREAARTPLLQAQHIKVPVIFFQGGQDAVVVPEQTRQMVQALQAQNQAVVYHEFAEQGHGFRSSERLAFVLEQELAFYQGLICR